MQRWYATVTNTGSPHEQGLVIDETTGANIAVTYDAAHAPIVAAAPDLLAALQVLAATARTFRNVPNDEQEWGPLDDEALAAAFAAIAKATASAAVAAARDVLNSITLED